MFRITSQLCEVFDCTDLELVESGLLDQFNAWRRANQDRLVSNCLEYGEMINGNIAARFFEFYKAKKRTEFWL